MYDDSVEGAIEHIETFLKTFGLEQSDIGMVVSPSYDQEEGSMAMDHFVKGDDDPHRPALDASVYPEVSDLEFNQKVYSEWVEAIEERFDQAEVYSADPEEIGPSRPELD